MIKIFKVAEELTKVETSLEIQISPPIWGKYMSSIEYYEWMRPRVENGRGLLLPAELGCSLAHLNIYKKIETSSESALIIEEDISLTRKTLDQIEAIISKIDEPDFVHFSQHKVLFQKEAVRDDIWIPKTDKDFWGTSAYYISVRMAKYLLSWHNPFVDKADNWQEIFIECPYTPFFSPVFEHDGEVSQIGDRQTPAQNPSVKKMIELRLRRWRMQYSAQSRHRRHLRKAATKLGERK